MRTGELYFPIFCVKGPAKGDRYELLWLRIDKGIGREARVCLRGKLEWISRRNRTRLSQAVEKKLSYWRWRQSPANLSLREFSLLSGKVQGISADSAAGTVGSAFRTINQVVAAKFPRQQNREFSRREQRISAAYRGMPHEARAPLLLALRKWPTIKTPDGEVECGSKSDPSEIGQQ